jgi:hypothetical protein
MSPQSHEPDPAPYRPQQLPQAAEQTLGAGSLRSALDVVRSVHEADFAARQPSPKNKEERWELNRKIRAIEQLALTTWSVSTGNFWDESTFTAKWKAYGEIEGGEHQLYQEGGYFFKRNNLFYHACWLEYFHRLVLHNWLFPETALQFEGLMQVQDSLQPVVSQKALLGIRGATTEEVEPEMARRGFVRRFADNYYNTNLGALVEDLHDENVLVSPAGSLLIFDPVIYLITPDMSLKLS